MGRLTGLLLFLSLLSGCTTAGPYGNLVRNPEISGVDTIARDTAERISVLHAPAKTRFSLMHSATDRFGSMLLQHLREKGFSVAEYMPDRQGQGILLAYVLDRSPEDGAVRVGVLMNGQPVTRLYTEQDGILVPQGVWTVRRQEP